MKRLFLVSNRLPITITKNNGKLNFKQSVGGLATGLGSVYKADNSLWIGWCGIPSDELNESEQKDITKKLIDDFKSYPTFFSKKDLELYYDGFCNETIWPLFHYFTESTTYDEKYWESYKAVNQHFCDIIMKIIEPEDIIWVHDYHLMLLPKLLRDKLPKNQIGFFLHIPFPSFEIFRLLPWRKEILEGLLGSDLIGFHTDDYVRHFLSSVRRLMGFEHTFGQISTDKQIVRVDTYPIGIKYEHYANAVKEEEVIKEIKKISKKTANKKVILSVDRLDYTKGILHRLEAFDLFLKNNPEYREKVKMILVAVPSRTDVENYIQLKKQVDELVGRINGEHGSINWMPVWYLYRSLPFKTLSAFYNISDIALVTPIRDGMNLIAKEFIAAKDSVGKGVLILSEMAGAAKELGEAIIVNPNDKEDIAEAIEKSIKMSDEEQIERNTVMQKRLRRYNIKRWAGDFLCGLSYTKNLQQKLLSKRISDVMRSKIINECKKSSSSLYLLDYDGTLVSFVEKPSWAIPDKNLLGILDNLSKNPKNDVIIISGRDKDTLEEWFGKLNIGLVAEHGVWMKTKGEGWKTIEPLRDDWKKEIRPIIEQYVDRTPGSFLEEKDFSMVWHYRRTGPDLAQVRVSELKESLLQLTENLNLGVMDGNKVIEVKNPVINKGSAAMNWVSKKKYDFILAAGDDVTDEDMFAILPETAYSIKVGFGPTKARLNLDSQVDMVLLLKDLER